MRSSFARMAADGRQKARVVTRKRDRRNVAALQGEVECFFAKAGRSTNVPERPEHQTKVDHGTDAEIVGETGGKMAISLVVIGRERLFEVRPRADVIALE